MGDEARTLVTDRLDRRRHASCAQRGPDRDLIEGAAMILLFVVVFGGFVVAIFTVAP